MRRVTRLGGVFFKARDKARLAEGVDVDPRIEESEFGRFGWAMDPEGHRVELWEPPKDR